MPILVKDIMSTPAYIISYEKNAREAGQLMRKFRRGFLVVTKNGKSVGVVSDSDLITEIVAKNKNAEKTSIKSVMRKPVVTVNPNDDILSAVRKMKTNNIHRLPVLEDGKLIGVISLTDIAKTSPEMLDLLEYRLKMKEQPLGIIKEKISSGICETCGNFSEKLENRNEEWVCVDCIEETETEE